MQRLDWLVCDLVLPCSLNSEDTQSLPRTHYLLQLSIWIKDFNTTRRKNVCGVKLSIQCHCNCYNVIPVIALQVLTTNAYILVTTSHSLGRS